MKKNPKISEPSTDEGFLPELRHNFPTLSHEEAKAAWELSSDKIALAIQGQHSRVAACSILNSPEGRQIARRVQWPSDIAEQASEVFMKLLISNSRFASCVHKHIDLAERLI